MKNTIAKQNEVDDGTYRIVGEALELKPGTIKMIRMGYRADRHNVMKALALVKEHQALSRAALIKKIKGLNKKKHSLNQQAA
jgi:hypothetical protein